MDNEEATLLAMKLAKPHAEKADILEKQNANIIKEMDHNHDMLIEFKNAIKSGNEIKSEIEKKNKLIKEKKEQLYQLQNVYLSKLTDKYNKPPTTKPNMEPVSVTIMEIQDLLFKLSEAAVDQNIEEIPLVSVMKANDAIQSILQTYVQSEIANIPEKMKKQLVDVYDRRKKLLDKTLSIPKHE